MMDVASSMTPPKPKKHRRHIPAELVEEILLNLEVKSLLRFSSVSKSWHSTIYEPGFVKRYRRRAALPGREGLVIVNPYCADVYSCGPLSDILSDETPVVIPSVLLRRRFKGTRIFSLCSGLCGIENWDTRSLYLWNPSLRTYRKLPNPPQHEKLGEHEKKFVFHGLGYDSVNDDYKILRLTPREYAPYSFAYERCAALYSLRNDSWKKIEYFPHDDEFLCGLPDCSFVSGALHWLLGAVPKVIVYFNLSTEKYGEVKLPTMAMSHFRLWRVGAVMGKLCLMASLICCPERENSIALWVMEDYGVVESWTKKFDIDCTTINPTLSLIFVWWKPLYFCEDGRIVIIVDSGDEHSGMYVYAQPTLLKKMKKVVHRPLQIYYGEVFVQSLVDVRRRS